MWVTAGSQVNTGLQSFALEKMKHVLKLIGMTLHWFVIMLSTPLFLFFKWSFLSGMSGKL